MISPYIYHNYKYITKFGSIRNSTILFLDPSGKGGSIGFVVLWFYLFDVYQPIELKLVELLASISTTVLPENKTDWGIVAHFESCSFFFFYVTLNSY